MSSYLKCPHCGYRLRTRNSIGEHPLLRTEYLECQNPGCHASFRGTREITHELSPSGIPNPQIKLEKASTVEKEQITAGLIGDANQVDLFLHQAENEKLENCHE